MVTAGSVTMLQFAYSSSMITMLKYKLQVHTKHEQVLTQKLESMYITSIVTTGSATLTLCYKFHLDHLCLL